MCVPIQSHGFWCLMVKDQLRFSSNQDVEKFRNLHWVYYTIRIIVMVGIFTKQRDICENVDTFWAKNWSAGYSSYYFLSWISILIMFVLWNRSFKPLFMAWMESYEKVKAESFALVTQLSDFGIPSIWHRHYALSQVESCNVPTFLSKRTEYHDFVKHFKHLESYCHVKSPETKRTVFQPNESVRNIWQ